MLPAGGSRGAQRCDPVLVDWANVHLPHAWPDELNLLRPRDLLLFVRRVVGPRRRVELPEGLPGRDLLPAYLLQEFHHLPNGTYSKEVAIAYATWFDRVMLGVMRKARRTVARALADCEVVLDVGCGAGGLAGALREVGVREVWGLDPCPYLLQCAARRYSDVHFVQGLAEATGFPDQRFAGIGASFLFHELPPDVADHSLAELHRILQPGGLVALAEPAREQRVMSNARALLRLGGLRALYFGILARFVYEPALSGWHARDLASWFARFGFRVEQDESRIPVRHILARKLP